MQRAARTICAQIGVPIACGGQRPRLIHVNPGMNSAFPYVNLAQAIFNDGNASPPPRAQIR
jgi:hypothetical protein